MAAVAPAAPVTPAGALAAAVGPLLMASVSDAYNSPRAGFMLATGFALLLFIGLLANWALDPTRPRLETADREDYSGSAPEPSRAP